MLPPDVWGCFSTSFQVPLIQTLLSRVLSAQIYKKPKQVVKATKKRGPLPEELFMYHGIP